MFTDPAETTWRQRAGRSQDGQNDYQFGDLARSMLRNPGKTTSAAAVPTGTVVGAIGGAHIGGVAGCGAGLFAMVISGSVAAPLVGICYGFYAGVVAGSALGIVGGNRVRRNIVQHLSLQELSTSTQPSSSPANNDTAVVLGRVFLSTTDLCAPLADDPLAHIWMGLFNAAFAIGAICLSTGDLVPEDFSRDRSDQSSTCIIALAVLDCAARSTHVGDGRLLMYEGKVLTLEECPVMYHKLFEAVLCISKCIRSAQFSDASLEALRLCTLRVGLARSGTDCWCESQLGEADPRTHEMATQVLNIATVCLQLPGARDNFHCVLNELVPLMPTLGAPRTSSSSPKES